MDKRLVIVTGHYGSGKTEFSVNYAVKCIEIHEKVCIADLDIVNPYFRTRERREFLEKLGIKVFDSSIKNTNLDIPAISPEITGMIQNGEFKSIIDVGGDPAGATSLARFSKEIKKVDYDMFYVINANRPETQLAEKTIAYMKNIELTSKLKVTGLVNNTHLLKKTTAEDVERGHTLTKEVSKLTGLPIKYESVIESVAENISNLDIKNKIFPIKLFMREDWMS